MRRGRRRTSPSNSCRRRRPTCLVRGAGNTACPTDTWRGRKLRRHRMFDAGTYVVSLGPPGMPRQIGEEAWLPSVSDNTVVYWENGLMAADLAGERTWQIDPLGDFPTAAPTYAAYFRPVEANGETKFEIVARGYEGAYEQVLATASLDPVFPPASARREGTSPSSSTTRCASSSGRASNDARQTTRCIQATKSPRPA